MSSATVRRSLVAVVAAATCLATAGSALGDLILEPEATYLQFRESDIDFVTFENDSDDTADGSVFGPTRRLDPDYEFGYRLGIGYSWEGGWDFMFRAGSTDIDEASSIDYDAGETACEPVDILKHLTSDYLKKKLGL